MDWLINIDWVSMFSPKESVLEIIIRGTIMQIAGFLANFNRITLVNCVEYLSTIYELQQFGFEAHCFA